MQVWEVRHTDWSDYVGRTNSVGLFSTEQKAQVAMREWVKAGGADGWTEQPDGCFESKWGDENSDVRGRVEVVERVVL